jgi:hypothetical protein
MVMRPVFVVVECMPSVSMNSAARANGLRPPDGMLGAAVS